MSPAPPADVLLHVLLTLAAIIILGRALGLLLRPLGQPQVIADIIAGILLGPSLIGPEAAAWLLPASAAPSLGLVAQLGVILYMFLVGLETNAGTVRSQLRQTVAISAAGMITPFLLGLPLALMLYPRFADPAIPKWDFALFIGVALSMTALPVLARILADRSMKLTPVGPMALACAAVGDVAAWCALAVVVGLIKAQHDSSSVLIGTLIFAAVMLLVVRPLMRRWVASLTLTQVGNSAVVIALVGCLLSAAATQWIGIHALFGAFLLGLLIPHDSQLAQTLERRLKDLVAIVFLPAFFAYSGLRTQIELVDSIGLWLIVLAIVLVATAGKMGGVTVAARLNGFSWRDAGTLGALMNARGLVELIVLNIGLDIGVITPTVYSMMILMALATTIGTAPLVRLFAARQRS